MLRRDTEQARRAGIEELSAIRRESFRLYAAVGLFSFFVNALMLTGPLYMLQVYDRVLGSRSEETLAALSILVVFLYGVMGVLDWARGRVAARIGARFQSRLDERTFRAAIARAAGRPEGASDPAATGLRDLESIRALIASPVLTALFDAPFTPIFLAAIFIFHPWLGVLAVSGGVVIVVITLLNQLATRRPQAAAAIATGRSERWAEQMRREAETVEALGMRRTALERWGDSRTEGLRAAIALADRSGGFSVATKTFRLFLQSAMLGLGAYVVLQGEMTAGAMIAASILLGRALAPIETVVGQWGAVQRARKAWDNLSVLLGSAPPPPARMPLSRPVAEVAARDVTVIPPGETAATLRMVSFHLPAGQALGVIGPSGAGKSTLARAITGVWPAAGGKVRIGGAALDQFDPDTLGRLVGYLPQRVAIFDGTVAQNIARLEADPDPAMVEAAARKAAAHDMILQLPDGYDTPLDSVASRLSGGQIQRLGLARALYGDPVLLVLDEPNANLDNEGTAALNAAVDQAKAEGRSAIIMAHRPSAIEHCEWLLHLDGGMRRAFGPRDEVLRQTVANHQTIAATRGTGGGAT